MRSKAQSKYAKRTAKLHIENFSRGQIVGSSKFFVPIHMPFRYNSQCKLECALKRLESHKLTKFDSQIAQTAQFIILEELHDDLSRQTALPKE